MPALVTAEIGSRRLFSLFQILGGNVFWNDLSAPPNVAHARNDGLRPQGGRDLSDPALSDDVKHSLSVNTG